MTGRQNFAQYFRMLQLLFFALLFAQIVILSILIFVLQNTAEAAELGEEMWLQIITIVSLVLLGGSIFLRKKLLDNAAAQNSLLDKLAQYRTAQIVSWAMMEGVTLLNAVFFFLSGRKEFMYIAGAVIVMFASRFPSKERLVNELDLNSTEQNTLDDPNADVMYPPPSED